MNIPYDDIKITPLLNTLRLQKIDDSTYFSKKYSDYISNSRLGLLNSKQGGSPEAFFKGTSGIYSDSIVIGSAVHELCLQKDLFHLCFDVDRPTGKLGFVADELYNSYLEDNVSDDVIIATSNKIGYYKDKLTKNRIDFIVKQSTTYWEQRRKYESKSLSSTPIYLDPNGREKVQRCVSAINRNSSFKKLLHPQGLIEDPVSENEQAILLDVKIDIPDKESFTFKLKSKLDNYTIDKETGTIVVNDIKTIGKILSEFNCKGGNIDKYSYRREIAMYSFLLQLCAKKYYDIENPICKGNFLVVSTIPQYYTKVVPMTKRDFVLGFKEFKYLLKLAAGYYAMGYRFS